MSNQPKALRLADFIEEHDGNFFYEESSRTDGELSDAVYEAAAELRRLHALNAELLEIANRHVARYLQHPKEARYGFADEHRAEMEAAIKVIAKATGEEA